MITHTCVLKCRRGSQHMGRGVGTGEPEILVKAYFDPILSELDKPKKLLDPPEVDLKGLKGYKTALKRG